MCGICGELIFDPSAPRVDLARMMQAIHHRGPDEEGALRADGIALGTKRLSIIDLAGGQQPIWNEGESACIVYNGELYNYLDLRPLLEAKGHCFRTHSDTEVILHAYEEWGLDCLRRLNGMFALAIWDVHSRTLFLARDRIGEKPLYYYRDEQRLVFASEIKAILADGSLPRAINLRGLANFVTFGHALAPDTIYQNIFKLPPAHCLLAREGEVTIKEYWDVDGDMPHAAARVSADEYAEQIRALLDDSVRRRMIADVPVGAFLSGGVDSSGVVALMKRHATGAVKTFSLGFKVDGFNELPDARRVAYALGCEHHELEVEHVDLIQTLQTLVYHYDEPFGDAAGFPIYLLSRFAREHVKVVLCGDGGDELFGGYRRYAADQFSSAYRLLPHSLAREWIPSLVNRVPRLRRVKRSVQTLPIDDPAQRYAHWLMVFNAPMRAQLLSANVRDALRDYDPAWQYPHYYAHLNGRTATDHLNRLMYVDVKTWLADGYMEKTDKATMACSLEARMPLLDHRLVELAFQIPSRYKIHGWATKRILKRAVRDLVPADVLSKRKHGFSVPTDQWFRHELKDFVFEVLMDERTRQRGYFNHAYVEQLYRAHQAGQQTHDTALWLLLNFELWHRIFMDGGTR